MASEIRVNQIQNRSGLGTVTFSDAGLSVSGILTATTFSGNLTGNVTGTVSSSGIATFSNGIIVAAGSTSAPSISPSGDSNTGIFFPSADTVAIAEGGVEALRVDSSSNIGIGTVPKNWSGFRSLQLGGTTSIWSVEGGVSGSSFYSNNIYFDGSNRRYLTTNAASEYIQDASTGNHIFYLASSGSSGNTLSGYSEIARFTSSGLKLPSGLGIDFSATANSSGTMTSELLSDYEEGTWTPAWTTSSGVYSGITYNTQAGNYTKIGNMVFYDFLIISTNWNGNTGAIWIAGLPYAASSTRYQQGGGSVFFIEGFNGSQDLLDTVTTQIQSGATRIELYGQLTSAGANYADLNNNHINEGGTVNLRISGQYFV